MISRKLRCSNILLHLKSPTTLQLAPCPRGISTELTTALRPFYFAVHPDLFGQHPEQRSVNEDSLKQLSAHMECLHERKYHALHEAKTLRFYIREEQARSRDTFKLIKLQLDKHSNDPKMIVLRLLQLCNLPTEQVQRMKTGYAAPPPAEATSDHPFGAQFTDFQSSFHQAREEQRQTIDEWLKANGPLALARALELASLKEEVEKLQKTMVARLGLRDVVYDCGWNYEHYRGCLKSLERLANLHEQHMDILRNRVVVFAPFTGISLEGHVMLFTGDVLNSWIDFIRNIPRQDLFLKKVPIYENSLSQVLRNIKIGRRKFMPKQQAVDYAGHLMKLTTTLGDYLSTHKYPRSWPATLEAYELVVESEAGPLMVNPTGQLIAPAACPGFMLVDFITAHLDVAKERAALYKQQKQIENGLIARCLKELKLRSLTMDGSVTPDKVIATLNELLLYEALPFTDIDLHITNFFSVLDDGVVCIPWDFMDKQ